MTISVRVRSVVHDLFAVAGVDLVRYSSTRHPIGRRMRLLASLGIDLVLDVGGNTGQFAVELRRHGYDGQIVSFEPLAEPFSVLAERSARDPTWDVVNIALGSEPGVATMYVAANSASSSLLQMLPLHTEAAPQARLVGTEEVVVGTLDDFMLNHLEAYRAMFLKIDVQGAEDVVLRGATGVLPRLAAVQLELSLFPLYAGCVLFDEMTHLMYQQGFILAGLESGLTSPTNGRLLQADGLFINSRCMGTDDA
jgi:FkbM family methyltransferase